MELVSRNIMDKAISLSEKNYQETDANFKLSECDSVLINHPNKQFWFTKRSFAESIIN